MITNRLPAALFVVGLTAAALLPACKSRQKTAATAPAAADSTASADAQATMPSTQSNAWYRQYRGQLPGQADSITLHLQVWPRLTNDTETAGVWASYADAAGHPFELNGDWETAPAADSIVLTDYNPEHVPTGRNEGPIWRLRRRGRELTGTVGGQPIRLREAQPPGSLPLLARYFEDSVAAFPGRPSSPHAQMRLLALLPPGAAPAALRDNLLRHLRGDTVETRAAQPLDSLWRQGLRAYAKEYRRDAQERRNEIPGDTSSLPEYALHYDQQQLMFVNWNQAPLLSLGYFTYTYSGGAHGYYSTRTISYDTRTGRPLHFADIFRPGTEDQLIVLLDRAARRMFGLGPNESLNRVLFVKHLPATHNVYLTSGGAVFVYPPYDIASFAQGEIRVFVPFRELRPLLRPGLPVGGGDMAGR